MEDWPGNSALLSGTVFPDVSTSSWVESSKIHKEMKKRILAIINPSLFQSSVSAMLLGYFFFRGWVESEWKGARNMALTLNIER